MSRIVSSFTAPSTGCRTSTTVSPVRPGHTMRDEALLVVYTSHWGAPASRPLPVFHVDHPAVRRMRNTSSRRSRIVSRSRQTDSIPPNFRASSLPLSRFVPISTACLTSAGPTSVDLPKGQRARHLTLIGLSVPGLGGSPVSADSTHGCTWQEGTGLTIHQPSVPFASARHKIATAPPAAERGAPAVETRPYDENQRH